ncbi:uncharacterized protein LOC125518691 [Triticum urartu]|uniref:uncharacterized protein LOC125518691 n=1 Tax=Triticum urartu TaxID=4572 RepID=UPI00204306BF|nr:uncharacterized protein LOC125518691 [Triticum urartu]
MELAGGLWVMCRNADRRLRVPPAPARTAAASARGLHHLLRGLCTTEAPPSPLSPSELDAISALIPRLISEGQVPAVGRLLSAALLLPGSPERLPSPPLAEHLASLPTLTPAFALLTALRHHPVRPSPLPLATPLLGHLLVMHHAREAAFVLRWLCRLDSPRRPDAATYGIAVAGFCRFGDARSALVALDEMASDRVPPSLELQEAVRDAMLQDARIEEAWALEEAMRPPESKKTGTKATRQERELRGKKMASEASSSNAATDLEALMSELGLQEEDMDDVVVEKEDPLPPTTTRWMAIARVHTEKKYSQYGFFKTMRAAWDLAQPVQF